jgi:hypothetical protein
MVATITNTIDAAAITVPIRTFFELSSPPTSCGCAKIVQKMVQLFLPRIVVISTTFLSCKGPRETSNHCGF